MVKRKADDQPSFEGVEVAPPPKKVKPESDGSTVRVQAAFKAAFAKRFGAETKQLWEGKIARSRKSFKALVEAAGEETVVNVLIPEFFASSDPQVERTQYEPWDLERLAQRLLLNRVRKNGSGQHARTAANVNEAAKAMGKTR